MTHLNPQQQAALAAVKAKYGNGDGGWIAARIKQCVSEACDELYAALCPPLDADVAAKIEKLKRSYRQVMRDLYPYTDNAIDETAALCQRQSAQPGSVERVKAELRAAGWMVAVHNDYRLNGEFHTFWLWTHSDGRYAKGEGKTDAEALAAVRAITIRTPATSDKEARVKAEDRDLVICEWSSAVGLPPEDAVHDVDWFFERLLGITPPLETDDDTALPTAPTEGE